MSYGSHQAQHHLVSPNKILQGGYGESFEPEVRDWGFLGLGHKLWYKLRGQGRPAFKVGDDTWEAMQLPDPLGRCKCQEEHKTVLRVRSLSEHWQRDSEGTPHKLEGPLVTSSCSACTSLGGDFCKPLMMAGSSQDIDRLFPLGGCKGCSVPLDGRKTRESAISFTDVFRRSWSLWQHQYCNYSVHLPW